MAERSDVLAHGAIDFSDLRQLFTGIQSQDAQQNFWIDRRSPRVTVARLQGLTYKSEVNVPVDKPQQMIFGNMIVQVEVVKERFRTSLLAHHNEQRASTENY